jgi:hypothetical protein
MHNDARGVRFGDCELRVERLELRRADKIVDMEHQVFDVVAYLLAIAQMLAAPGSAAPSTGPVWK